MVLQSRCPACPCADCLTLREVSREAPSRWWRRIATGRTVRRFVTGYVKQCPLCDCRFIVTIDGQTRITPEAPPMQDIEDDTVVRSTRKQRPEPRPWMEKPSH